MDDRRFDALTRAMAQGSSRRTALKGLVGGLVGGAAVVTRHDRAGAQQACQSDQDCYTDACSSWICLEGTCLNFFSCEQGQTCCDITVTCIGDDQCCDSSECSDIDCEVCSSRSHTCVSACDDGEFCCEGTCYNPSTQCCDRSECGPPPDSCSEYICSDYTCELRSSCEAGETCCADGSCAAPSGCCVSSECQEPCSICTANVCVSTCTEPGTICCDDICYNGDSCCLDAGEQCDATQLGCCEDLQCCSSTGDCAVCCVDTDCPVNHFCCDAGGANAHCEFCCEDDQCEGEFGYCDEGHCYLGECNVDSDCEACQSCFAHQCFQIGCLQGEVCCGNHECVPEDECQCRAAGQTCGEVTITAEGPEQYDCCDGLLCCFGQNTNICAQCCSDSDCDAGGTCEDWVCVYPGECEHNRDCPKGTCCCDDGDCSSKCCPPPPHPKPHPHPKPPKPAPSGGGSVTTLPATGSGTEQSASGLLGAAALGAAALFAAKTLRDQQTSEIVEASPIEE